MPIQPELWLVLYTLSGFIALLLAISTLFSISGYLLRPWFDRQERWLHALPPDQYLAFFAFPLLATLLGGIINLGTAKLMDGGLESITSISVLFVVFCGAIYAGLSAARQLVEARRRDPMEMARSDSPVSMRLALAELMRGVNTLIAEAPVVDLKRLRFDYKKLHRIHDQLEGLLDELRQRESAQRLVTRPRDLATGYTGLVSLATLVAVVLAVAATLVRIVTGGDVLRAAGLGAALLTSAVGLWSAGMWLRGRTHSTRAEALKNQLTEELNTVRNGLDDVVQHIQGVPAVIWISGGPADGEEMRNAFGDFLAELDFVEASREPANSGSWWQRLKFRSQNFVRSAAVTARMRELERRLQRELVESRTAEVDRIKTESACRLIAAIDVIEQAVIILGQVVIVKFDGTIIVRSIDPLTAAKIEQTRTLLSDPRTVAEMISNTDRPPTAREVLDNVEDDNLPERPPGELDA